MRKFLFLFAALLFISGCSNPFDDTAINDRLDNLEERVEALEELCNQMNTNIEALQTIVAALQNNDYITSVTPITENGEEIGYTITFAKSNPITIYHGQDGEDGADGIDGTDGIDGVDGEDGKDGSDGHTPVIGVRQDTDGIYYWTLDGEWLLDDNGNKIKAVGEDGKDGVDGEDGADGTGSENGKDGITPQLKIEDGYWYVSYDNGITWHQLGKATGEDGQDGEDGKDGEDGQDGTDGKDGDSMFKEIRQDDSFVYFVLTDGTELKVPTAAPLSISFDTEDLVIMAPNSSRDIRYTITSTNEEITIEVLSSSDIKAKVMSETETTGKIHVQTSDVIDEYSKVVVLLTDGVQVIMHTLTFEEEAIQVSEKNNLEISADGGNMTLYYLSNTECEVIIPEEATWIHLVSTKVLQEREVVLTLDPNPSYARSANVVLRSESGLSLTYTIVQQGEQAEPIDPTSVPDNEIWYRTAGGVNEKLYLLETGGFDANIVEHVYENDKWVIRFDNTVTVINELNCREYNSVPYNVLELLLPDSIEYIYDLAVAETISNLYIPKNLKYIYMPQCVGFEKLSSFSGNNTDGRSIIIDGKLLAFASSGIEEYTIPDGVETIGQQAFSYCSLKTVNISEGVKTIENDSFYKSTSLEYVNLPSTLEYIDGYAFWYCTNIKKFHGPSNFVPEDGMCIYTDNYYNGLRWLISFACGSGLTEYIIPEGINAIGDYAFADCKSLQKLTFPSSLIWIASGVCFEGCDNLSELYGPNTSDDHHCLIIDSTLFYFAGSGIKEYTIPEEVNTIGFLAFYDANDLEVVRMSDNITTVGGSGGGVGYIFWNCPNLREVTISANMVNLGMDPFGTNTINGCNELEKVYCRAIVPPVMEFNNPDNVLKFENLKIYVPEQSLESYKSSKDWEPYWDYIVGYEYTDLPESEVDYYRSTDYSRDGNVTVVQTATVGNGIDLVLMGDAFSDRQIEDGTYMAAMDKAIDAMFSEEPYKSFRDMFNIYVVDVVSLTEGYEHDGQALETYFGEGTHVGGNGNKCFEYAQKAISDDRMDEVLVVIMMNKDAYAGTCSLYFPSSGNYGNGPSIAYFPTSSNDATSKGLMLHEAGGHGFAKLDDEYAYESMGAFPESAIEQREYLENYGWWKNTDLTNDISIVKWAHFLADERYQYDGLGVYEGASTYWTGAWRPTENSIMRYNEGGFNAPSREAIYYRIHKLAYGEDWEYDYEDFVIYDAINRKTAAEAASPQLKPQNIAPWVPTTPPVVVGKTWREAMEEANTD